MSKPREIMLSDGTSYVPRLIVMNVTGINEERGFRLGWENPGTGCYVPALGLATSNPFRTEREARAFARRQGWGEAVRSRC